MGSCASAPNCKRLDRSVAIEVISDIDGIGVRFIYIVCQSRESSLLTKFADTGSFPSNFVVSTVVDHICLFETLPTQ